MLVNCAAAWGRKRLEDVTPADVRSFFEVNSVAPFICSQRLGLAMARKAIEEQGGRLDFTRTERGSRFTVQLKGA